MNPQQPISFPGWKAALAASNLSPVVKSSHTRAILTLLHHCKKSHSPVTVVLIKQWLKDNEAAADGPAHVALRWFYRNAPKVKGEEERLVGTTRPAGKEPTDASSVLGSSRSTAKTVSYNQRPPWRPMEPRPASQDLGGPDWEQALVATMRVRGLLSRTEDTYRSWGKRFAAFIAPKSPYAASGEEEGAFLTDLAVNNRASPSNQRQALNALVFVTMRPGLPGTPLGHPPLRFGPALDANRGLTISALPRSVSWKSRWAVSWAPWTSNGRIRNFAYRSCFRRRSASGFSISWKGLPG